MLYYLMDCRKAGQEGWVTDTGEVLLEGFPHLQKKRKYGEVVSMIMTATMSSFSSSQASRSQGMLSMHRHEKRNMTRDGAVI